jgi:hypothetical protein
MKRIVLVIVVFLVAITAGVGIGYLAGRNNLLGREPVAKSRGVDESDWKQWKYPGSRELASSQGGGIQVMETSLPQHYCLAMATRDDFEKVLGFYADKTGIANLATVGGGGSRVHFDSAGTDIEDWFAIDDSLPANRSDSAKRPVKTKVFAKRTLAADVTMFISRATDEQDTHIILAYYPRR